ncbi:PQQ-binding-like beta-propeller repeat protein [Streptosporangium sp. DT93]|uniref:outer membrane protein assembly factor BamB family protein n=1 Tax=Streptosporangium sp. DT93 TaxID=3393428 RepID=UPI003CF73C48
MADASQGSRGSAGRSLSRRALLAGCGALAGGAGLLVWKHTVERASPAAPGTPGATPATSPAGTAAWPVTARPYQVNKSLTLSGDRMYVADEAGDVLALDAATGRRHWTFTPRRPGGASDVLVTEAPVDGKGSIFVGSHRGRTAGEVVALSAADGRPRWSRPAPGPVLGIALDGTALVYATDTSLHVLDALTGGERWTLPLYASNDLVLRDGLVVTAYRHGPERRDRISAHRLLDGGEVWSHDFPRATVDLLPTPGPMIASASLNPLSGVRGLRLSGHSVPDGRTVWSRAFDRAGTRLESLTATHAIVTNDRNVQALRTGTGETMWTFRQPRDCYPGVWNAGDVVVLAITVADRKGYYEMVGLDAGSGGERWRTRRREDTQEAVTGEGRAYVTLTGNRDRVVALDLDTGATLWRTGVPSGSSLVLGRHLLYVCAPDVGEPGGGAIHALDPAGGEQVRR